jgi:hypothetical protein
MEVASSLDTDSFLNAMRRFLARRGNPEEIKSINEGSFVSEEKHFLAPSAFHHGGVWERCIRMVRKVMKALLHEQTLNNESLYTLMCEFEAIINGDQ